MKICFDDTLSKNFTGIGQDARLILGILRKGQDVTLLSELRSKYSLTRFHRRLIYLYFLITSRPIKVNLGKNLIYYQPHISPFVPKNSRTKWVIRIHDIFPITDPKWFRRISVRIYKRSLFYAVNHNALFLCSSEYSRNELLSNFPELHGRVFMFPCVPREFTQNRCNLCSGCQMKLDLSIINYLVAVGTVEPRKNYNFLIHNLGM